MAKESIPFTEYPALHQLENYHGVELGNKYSIANSAKIFTNYIAESQSKAFLNDFMKCKFFSFLIDGFADAGNLDYELIVVQYSMKDSNVEEVKSITRYLTVCNPVKCDADSLLNCLSSALNQIGIEDSLEKESVLGIQQLPALVGGRQMELL